VIDELTPQLYRLRLGRFQAYVWRDDDTVTLIDTGEAGAAPTIAAALRELGSAPSDVGRVVLTDFHDDHAGAAAQIRTWGDVEVVAHAADAPVLRGDQAGPLPNLTDFERALQEQVATGLQPAPAVDVDVEVRDGDVVPFGGGAHIVATPGHTDGSIAVHLPAHGVLLTGDVAAEHAGEVILGVFNLDRNDTARSFHRLAELDADVVAFGHGEPVVGHAAHKLRAAASRLS
jgi:glyoxylase-like metal-dependent hydrolase (beta-lactamase superfamily II)